MKNVFWKTATSSITAIPPSVLLPDFASEDCTLAFVSLKKAALLVSGFNLSADEIRYFNSRKTKPDFDGLDFNQISLNQWLRLEAYTRLRNSLPETKTNILAFFNWTTGNLTEAEKPKLSEKIAELTLWKKERIEKLIAVEHFNLNIPSLFQNEEKLLKLKKLLLLQIKLG